MDLNEKIKQGRKAKGLTQEELATLTKVNLRTIQRIESGKSKPRSFTLKAIEAVLGIRSTHRKEEDTANFLHLLCLSCFSYLVIPCLHFLLPNYLLNCSQEQDPEVRRFAKKVIQEQIYWVIATTLVFLVVLLINFILRYYFNTGHYISYLIPFFGMYALNIILIAININRARAFAV
ncbi:MAG: helix-turn-helix domain-containing protein [Mucilaginibacter sp.]